MIKKNITWIDYDENKRTEDFYFNLNEAELILMEVGEKGGFERMLKRIIAEDDRQKIIDIFKELVLKAYGQKTTDGRRFVKSKELSKEFEETEAYVQIFMELATDAKAASDFVNGIVPKNKEKPGEVLPLIKRES